MKFILRIRPKVLMKDGLAPEINMKVALRK